MPMGITRVSEQYGYLAQSQERQEYLAAHEAEARQIAANHVGGYRIPKGSNDPRGRAREAALMTAGDAPPWAKGDGEDTEERKSDEDHDEDSDDDCECDDDEDDGSYTNRHSALEQGVEYRVVTKDGRKARLMMTSPGVVIATHDTGSQRLSPETVEAALDSGDLRIDDGKTGAQRPNLPWEDALYQGRDDLQRNESRDQRLQEQKRQENLTADDLAREPHPKRRSVPEYEAAMTSPSWAR